MKPHLNGCDGDTEGFGGLLHVALFEFAEDEDFSIVKWQGNEGAPDECADLLTFERF